MLRLIGKTCACTLENGAVTMEGAYRRYERHKRIKASEPITVDLKDVLRVGVTKTYSRSKFLIPTFFGFAAIAVKSIPSLDATFELVPDFWVTCTLWSIPFQDVAWQILGALCLLTIPVYWLSCRKDLEVNTMRGRFLLSQKGMDAQAIIAFQNAVSQAKAERGQ